MSDFTSIKASITLTSIADGKEGSPAQLLDWVKDWDSNKVQIGDTAILSPKVFTGTVTGEGEAQTITGIAFGRDVLGTGESAGLVAYNRNTPTIRLNTDGSAVFGSKPGKQFIINADGSISTPKITITDVDANFATDLDLGANLSNSGVTMFFNYDGPISIMSSNPSPQNVFYQGVNLKGSSNLSLHLLLTGTASTDCEVTIHALVDNINFGFSPMKQKIAAGSFIIGLPMNAFHLSAGTRYFQFTMETSSGTITIPQNCAQFAIEGKQLVGGTSAEAPHAEALDVITWGGLIKGFTSIFKQGSIDISDANINSLIDDVGATVSDHIPNGEYTIMGNIPIETVSFEMIDRGFLEDLNSIYKGGYTYNDYYIVFNDTCCKIKDLDPKTTTFAANGVFYECPLVDFTIWNNIESKIL